MVPISQFGADRSAKNRPQDYSGAPRERGEGNGLPPPRVGQSVPVVCRINVARQTDRCRFSRPLCLPQCERVAALTSARRRSFCHAIRKPLSLCFAARDPTRPARELAVRSDHAQSVGRSWSYWPLFPSLSHDRRADIQIIWITPPRFRAANPSSDRNRDAKRFGRGARREPRCWHPQRPRTTHIGTNYFQCADPRRD